MTMARLPISSPRHARQAALISLAMWDDEAARAAWIALARVARLLAGRPEDVGPDDVLRARLGKNKSSPGMPPSGRRLSRGSCSLRGMSSERRSNFSVAAVAAAPP